MNTAAQKIEDYSKSVVLPWWAIQLIAWLLFCVLSFLSLTLWYGNPRWMHVFHIALQAITGALVAWPLSRLLPIANKGGVFRRVISHLLLVGAVAFTWNIFRMASFDAMITAPDIWQEFGGWYFTALLIFSLWAALYYVTNAYSAIFAERERVKIERIKRIEAESLSRETQMKMLRYQLNPHFLFNTLNSISALVKTQRSDQARTMILQLSNFLRLTLESEGSIEVALAEEIKTLKLYLAIEEVRYTDRLTTIFDLDPSLMDAKVPTLILQPLFENSLKYSVAGKINGGTISLRGKLENDKVILEVTDTGDKTIDKERLLLNLSKGVGLQNIERRMQTHFGDEADVLYDVSEAGGLKVRLTFPYIKVGEF